MTKRRVQSFGSVSEPFIGEMQCKCQIVHLRNVITQFALVIENDGYFGFGFSSKNIGKVK